MSYSRVNPKVMLELKVWPRERGRSSIFFGSDLFVDLLKGQKPRQFWWIPLTPLPLGRGQGGGFIIYLPTKSIP